LFPFARFREVEELNSAGAGWDLAFKQLGRGELNASMGQVSTSMIDVVQLYLGNSVHQSGVTTKGYRSFALVEQGCPDYQWCGQMVGPGNVMLFDARNGYESLSPAGFRAFSVGFQQELLESVVAKMQLSDALDRLPDAASVASPGLTQVHHFLRHLVKLANAIAQASPTDSDKNLEVRAMENQICGEFIQLMVEEPNSTKIPLRQRARALKRAVDFIEANAREAISIADVCAAVSVTPRTLERSFREFLGTSPGTVIKKVRLEGVHLALLQREPSKKINELAAEWSFWHMGDFAKDYFNEYRELPRETRSKVRQLNSS
jgi:AraC-like DNA-binding protein